MEKAYTIAIPFDALIDDLAFHLLEKTVRCPRCAGTCLCEGYNGHDLVYRCAICDTLTLDRLDFEPLFAADALEAATMQHYEIRCPYCGSRAPLVGGGSHSGLFFVCEDRCHVGFVRSIRRF